MDSMGTHGFHGYPWNSWVPMEPMEFMRTQGIHGYPWNPWGPTMDSKGKHLFHGYPWNPYFSILKCNADEFSVLEYNPVCFRNPNLLLNSLFGLEEQGLFNHSGSDLCWIWEAVWWFWPQPLNTYMLLILCVCSAQRLDLGSELGTFFLGVSPSWGYTSIWGLPTQMWGTSSIFGKMIFNGAVVFC
jgi:hypothetical protein